MSGLIKPKIKNKELEMPSPIFCQDVNCEDQGEPLRKWDYVKINNENICVGCKDERDYQDQWMRANETDIKDLHDSRVRVMM